MKTIRGKRKRSLSCEKNTEMKCPLSAEPLVSSCTEQRVTVADDKSDNTLSPRKKCVLTVKYFPPSDVSSVTFPPDSAGSGRGKENKECHTPECLARTLLDETTEKDGQIEDSGYLSLQNSHHELNDLNSTFWSEPSKDTFLSSSDSTPELSGQATSTLPIVSFYQEVCHQLSETYKETKRYDWSVISKLANNSGLQNVIGGKMGLECLDILNSLMEKDLKHILTRILKHLGGSDLISCKKVSKAWRGIISQDSKASRRCSEAEQRIQLKSRPTGSFTRDFAPSRVVLSSMQNITSTPVNTRRRETVKLKHASEGQATIRTSQFHKFQEAAKTLKNHEGLRSCRQCSSPARYDGAMKRAVCMRNSCGYDFCTLCLGAFHGSSTCRTGVLGDFQSRNSAKTHLPCSKQSKRNIRRL